MAVQPSPGDAGWREQAACKSASPQTADEFFFLDHDAPITSWWVAREYCSQCPVAAACLQSSIDTAAGFGMWGGMTPAEREEAGYPTGGTRRRAGQPSPHGTYSRWHAGCRCHPCVLAKREYSRKAARNWKRGTPRSKATSISLPTYIPTPPKRSEQ